ncbi:MAG: cytochrome c maturation protein CcmE [Saprospiraceae bacterium]
MKKVYIIAGIMFAVAVSLFVMAQDDMGAYSTISEAAQTGKRVKLVGQLAKDMEMVYEPIADPNLFTFHLRDEGGKVQKVKLLKPKPQDFELSEQIVVTGRMQGDDFVATDILMKCPSKYKDEEVYIKEKQG